MLAREDNSDCVAGLRIQLFDDVNKVTNVVYAHGWPESYVQHSWRFVCVCDELRPRRCFLCDDDTRESDAVCWLQFIIHEMK